MTRLADATLAAIRDIEITAIADLVGLGDLHRGGSQLMTMCLLHAERTPSMALRGNVYHCHGCGAGGDVIDLVMRVRNVAFVEAARLIAAQVGIALDADPVALPPPRPRPLRKCEWPSKESIDAIARACVPVTHDAVVAAYLESRAINPHVVAHLRLGFALRADADHRRAQSGHRFVVPLYDAHGTRRSVVFRRVEGSHPAKTLGVEGATARGLVFACPGALAMLRGESWGHLPGERATVMIAEGEIDALTLRQHTDVTAVLGVRSGSWSPEIASRVPDGARVIVATHHDVVGERYATRIVETLAGRELDVHRAEPWSEAA